ncbi:hypothetical protein E2C01_033220 [Portunus trituberculatus]|uniref:Uncharacterized protein n=1 Tax=Portunus trituberculatus TaxID=210409 RepID=A0A5B7F2V8_PORTR|nr:hypothetical protein [Portunus trituberculatus]
MTRGAPRGPPVAAARHNNLTGRLLGGRVLLLTNIVRIDRLPWAAPPLGAAAAHGARGVPACAPRVPRPINSRLGTARGVAAARRQIRA